MAIAPMTPTEPHSVTSANLRKLRVRTRNCRKMKAIYVVTCSHSQTKFNRRNYNYIICISQSFVPVQIFVSVLVDIYWLLWSSPLYYQYQSFCLHMYKPTPIMVMLDEKTMIYPYRPGIFLPSLSGVEHTQASPSPQLPELIAVSFSPHRLLTCLSLQIRSAVFVSISFALPTLQYRRHRDLLFSYMLSAAVRPTELL